LGVAAPTIRLAHLDGKGCRDKAPGRVVARTPVSPSSAPARLAVGFGPKEIKPYTSVQCPLAIHPKDLIGPIWVPRPPAPPGVSALQHSVVTRRYTPRTGGCQYPQLPLGLIHQPPRRWVLENSYAASCKEPPSEVGTGLFATSRELRVDQNI
jgi:hypothetical protein